MRDFYTWNCDGFGNYNGSEENAWKAGAKLKTLVDNLNAKGYKVRILAHSQGNVVAGQALRILPADSVKAYIATQAAISGHCYGSMVNPTVTKDGVTTTVIIDNIVTNADGLPDIYKYYYSGNPFYQSGTPPAQNKPYLDEVAEKTKMVNSYNRNDYALDWWKRNNNAKKEGVYSIFNPLTWFTYKIDNYKFYKGSTELTCDNNPDGNLDNRFEIFSYAAFSHSHALGVGAISGNSNFDLKTNIFQVYGTNTNMNSHLYHSWQFRQSLPETKAYWKMVIGNCSTPAYRIELLHNAF